ncbi:MAG: hypothetical protein EOP48_03235 [Sphingobacteriales bacterium]|nr:MAG: hypothetical protein EOP48_03235 [Sphingobacteriales bacterium]
MNNSFLESIFKLLSANLQYPYYQGERRIDIFINFFLEDIIRQNTHFTDAEYLVPEFPLKKNDTSDHAAHIDYLMFSKKENTVLLVELKTDNSSISESQIDFYLNHRNFSEMFEKYSTIKMKNFTDKKEVLNKRLELLAKEDHDKYDIALVILKPSLNDKDHALKDVNNGRLYFVPLADLELETQHQAEWELFKNTILKNLRIKARMQKGGFQGTP